MLSGKFTWFVIVQVIIYMNEGCSCLNATQNVTREPPKTINTTAISPSKSSTSSTEGTESTETPNTFASLNVSAGISQNVSELLKNIFQVENITTPTVPTEQFSVDYTITTNCVNVSSVNVSCSNQPWNDTFKTNYTTVAEAVGSSEGSLNYALQNSAAIAAGVFLISAVVGYLSCVGYRHFLQRKYGNSQILIGEEVYDTSDLRYFEI